jgi:hypothetical protein
MYYISTEGHHLSKGGRIAAAARRKAGHISWVFLTKDGSQSTLICCTIRRNFQGATAKKYIMQISLRKIWQP